MFQLPLLGAAVPGLTKAIGPGSTLTAADLESLLQGAEELAAGFSGELQAMLMQLSPQMLQQLEERMAGGMTLPQAAKSLLAEVDEQGVGSWFKQLVDEGMAEPPAEEALPVTVTKDTGKMTAPARVSGELPSLQMTPVAAGADLVQPTPTPPPAATAVLLPVVNPVGSTVALPSPLTTSLLDMGVPQAVGDKAWGGAIGERIMWMVQGDQQFARLQLNPPQLGPLEVRVSVNQDQTSVSFLASHAVVREALEAALPRLREMFDQQSLQLVRADVSDPGAQHGGSDAGRSSEAGEAASGLWADDDQELVSEEDTSRVNGTADSLVDLFA